MKRLFLIFSLGLILFLTIPSASSASVIFQDSFQGGISQTNWTLTNSNNLGPYYNTSPFGIKDQSSQGLYTDLLTANIPYINNNEIKVDVKISNNDASNFNINCRKSAISVLGAQFYSAGNGNTIDTFNGIDATSYSWDNSNGTHQFDIICNNSHIIINEDGNTIYNDSTHLYQVDLGTRAELTFGDGHTSEFADFKLCDLNGCDNNFSDINLNIPLLKQTDPQWSTQEYDSAHLWSPSDQGIGSWGCAITSATMVLNYYGITKLPDNQSLNPGTLNTWLKSQPDGYIRGGFLNWLALAKLSRQAKQSGYNPGFAYDALEYTRGSTDASTLTNDLQNSHPDILEEPGHFIVAKGTQGNTFTINDPYYNRITLNDGYSNAFLSLGRYIPSHTDLSYMLFAADPHVTLQLQTASGSAVGQSYTQSPLKNANNPSQLSGNPIQLFYFQKPDDGTYSLHIQAEPSQPYTVDTYLYDKDGEVKKNTIEGITEANTDIVTIHFSKDTLGSETIQKQVTVGSTLRDAELLYKSGYIQKGMYQSIKQLLENAQKEQDKGNMFTAKVHLKVIQAMTSQLNPLISSEAKEVLGYDISILLK